MPDPHQTDLIREATAIFLRLRDSPDEEALQEARDQFLARGEAERLAYAKMLEVWNATETGQARRGGALPLVLALAILIPAVFFGLEPARILLLSDLSSGSVPQVAQLASGDRITLDAQSAVIDDTMEDARRVTLMQGAGFFEVESAARPFIVAAGAIEVTVLGTAFEVGRLGDGAVISVAEGSVQVSQADQDWQLSAGVQLILDGDGRAELGKARDTATWRGGLLIADGLNLAQVASIIDRRLPGRVVIADRDLGQTEIVGTFDLADPAVSLRLLAELEGAEILAIPSIVTILRR